MKRTTKPVKRAILEVMQSVPPGCIAHPVPDEDTAPHLHCGEFAVIDTRDRDPIIGEIYVIERNATPTGAVPGKRRRIVEVCVFGDATFALALFVGPLRKNQYIPEHGATRMLDGGYTAEGLRSRLVGRVVGVLGYVSRG